MSKLSTTKFANILIAWHKINGRSSLPWQKQSTPYRVWVSEIMLQQTQVNTVIPYYQKFMNHFPSLKSLALANQDQVLTLWAGLGYYSRARNLHKTAQILREQYNGRFPQTLAELTTLPGIGRSTAGAILSFAKHLPTPILDGNVKRVLCRYHAIAGWPGEKKIIDQLWNLSEQYTPQMNTHIYNQAIMDLGALVCKPNKPNCSICPLQLTCKACQSESVAKYPFTKPKQQLPQKSITLIMLQNSRGEILLQKRPNYGIWGGLWSFPECSIEQDLEIWCQDQLNIQISSIERWKKFKHSFTHFQLTIHPVLIRTTSSLKHQEIMESTPIIWYKYADKIPFGLPTPVAKLLSVFNSQEIA